MIPRFEIEKKVVPKDVDPVYPEREKDGLDARSMFPDHRIVPNSLQQPVGSDVLVLLPPSFPFERNDGPRCKLSEYCISVGGNISDQGSLWRILYHLVNASHASSQMDHP
jgi:hypothetical protein